MPMGSVSSRSFAFVWKMVLKLKVKKSKYLKMKRKVRATPTLTPTATFAFQVPRFLSTTRAPAYSTAVEMIISRIHLGSPHA